MTKKNKALLSLLLSFSFLFSCTAKKGKISLFVYDKNDTFISSLTEKLSTKLTEKKLDYEIYDSNRSQMQQNKDIVDSIDKNNTSLLLVNLVDRLSAYTTMEKAIQKDVPVVFFNREPLKSDMDKALKYSTDIYFVGTNATSEGEKQAYMAKEIFRDPQSLNPLYDHNGDNVIQAVLLKGEIGNQDTENRSLSFLSAIKRLGFKIEILDSVYCDWMRDKGYDAMKKLYEDYGDRIELVVSNNDDMALGAIDSLLDQKVLRHDQEMLPFEFLGVDAIDESMPYLEEGLFYGTVKNDAEIQSDAILKLSEHLLYKEEIDDDFPYPISESHAIYIEGKAVTKNNINELK